MGRSLRKSSLFPYDFRPEGKCKLTCAVFGKNTFVHCIGKYYYIITLFYGISLHSSLIKLNNLGYNMNFKFRMFMLPFCNNSLIPFGTQFFKTAIPYAVRKNAVVRLLVNNFHTAPPVKFAIIIIIKKHKTAI